MKERIEKLQGSQFLEGLKLPADSTEQTVALLEGVVAAAAAKVQELEQLANENLGDGNQQIAALTAANKQLAEILEKTQQQLAAAEGRAKAAGARPTVEIDGETFEVVSGCSIPAGELKGAYTADQIAKDQEVAIYLQTVGSGSIVELEVDSEND